jgi:hypothetical protein
LEGLDCQNKADMMAKGQITIFIIIGILVLVFFSVLFYVTSQDSRSKLDQEKEKVLSLFRERGKYHRYIMSCLDQSVKEGLVTAGWQGGVIYSDQAAGTKTFRGPLQGFPYGRYVLPFEPFADKDTRYYVSYGISPGQKGSAYHPDIPDYPYGLTRLVPDPKTINPAYVNTLGNFPLPGPFTPLCDSHGANRPQMDGHAYTCETYDSANVLDSNSVQEYLEAYIANKTGECVRLETLDELKSMHILEGNVTANITFGESHIYVNVDFPVTISKGSEEVTFNLQDFNTDIRHRLKSIHQLASHLINEDVNNIFFNIVKDAGKLNDCRNRLGEYELCLKPGMKVWKRADVCPACVEGSKDDVLMISDNESAINGEDYIFAFAIKNRPPALDLVRQNTFSTAFGKYDYIISINQSVVLNPRAYDPDEDLHNDLGFMEDHYRYSMWKESYDEYFDAWNCFLQPLECAAYPEKFVQMIPTDEPPRNFTKSAEYLATRRAATYKTTDLDAGAHSLKIEACDNENLCDYQIVRILVQNKPIISPIQPYTDIPNNITSIEDYITLSVFLLGGTMDLAESFTWTDTFTVGGVPAGFTRTTSASELRVPWTDIDINTIRNEYFRNIGTHIIDVEVKDTAGATVIDQQMGIDVRVCLPHRSPNPPWPFNISDPFMANHSCCEVNPINPSEYRLRAAGEECYRNTEYGCRASFAGPGAIIDDKGYAAPNNDVYQKDLIGTCDGTRGNICNGSVSTIISHKEECDDRCESCVPGFPGCSENAYSSRCTISQVCAWPGRGYDAETNIPAEYGPMLCYGGCNMGSCQMTTDCACNVSSCYAHGAECDDANRMSWIGNICSYGCGTDCSFERYSVICEAPATSCYSELAEACIYEVGCTESGGVWQEGEECKAAGIREPAPSADDTEAYCYFRSLTGVRDCDSAGSCTNKEAFPEDCSAGRPGSGDNYCLVKDGNLISCLHGNNLCPPDGDGWDYSVDDLDCLFDDGLSSCLVPTGMVDAEGDIYDNCTINIGCFPDGMSYNNRQCHRTTYGRQNTGTCWYESAGNDYDREDDCTSAGCDNVNIRSCVLTAGRRCTPDGCVPI